MRSWREAAAVGSWLAIVFTMMAAMLDGTAWAGAGFLAVLAAVHVLNPAARHPGRPEKPTAPPKAYHPVELTVAKYRALVDDIQQEHRALKRDIKRIQEKYRPAASDCTLCGRDTRSKTRAPQRFHQWDVGAGDPRARLCPPCHQFMLRTSGEPAAVLTATLRVWVTDPPTVMERHGALVHYGRRCPDCGMLPEEWEGPALSCERCATATTWNPMVTYDEPITGLTGTRVR